MDALAATTALPASDESATQLLPIWKQPEFRRWGLVAAGALALLLVVVVVVVIVAANSGQDGPADPGGGLLVAGARPPGPTAQDEAQRKREELLALEKKVEQHLQQKVSSPSGVDDAIDLAVLYLDQKEVGKAEALFQRMDARPAPSAYHYVGRLGLAVTDALNLNYAASHARFKELFSTPRSKDKREETLNHYLKKNPEFADWVREADSYNVRSGAPQASFSQDFRSRFPTGGSRPTFGGKKRSDFFKR